ncbi:hypothetical protein H8356DRAFT_936903 [Neocallimastix lanati (nom. inval.)]|uniref:Uncharacterized protein n=1 Tax=Neocallimastix californiae TaxID=1754190 RepID=A0A1Y2CYQ6_9FUNG|nr:hypothetical protein H8356DRAFT_936903 [Neocallimastix sp. JGI-2020a]ORY52163.1 hypothetical protein LY90DRAFT_508284 [Neocallimastix californiae]|eukprot:ORY52163.1 hypothetical protein LY90DRAFT_508284 [Neocallimastix californiae]
MGNVVSTVESNSNEFSSSTMDKMEKKSQSSSPSGSNTVYGKDGYYLVRIKYNPKKEQLESEDFINNKIESIFNVIKNNVETYNEVEYVKKEIDKYENFENLKRKRHIINDDNNVIGGDDKLRK